MREASSDGYVAECFWTGVKSRDLAELDERAGASAAKVSADGKRVRYLGSMLMRQDEVVLCFFEGTEEGVRLAAEEARIPFERIVETTGSAWSSSAPRKSRRGSR